jgi:putative DNA primase/helicase
MRTPIEQFRDALARRSIIAPDELLADGQLHRCDVDGGKRGNGDAAYLLHLDGVPAGGIENWRDGLGWEKWRANIGRKLTPVEDAAYRARIETARRERDAEKTRRNAKAATRALELWKSATPCESHPYLTAKGIRPHGVRVADWVKRTQDPASGTWTEMKVENCLILPVRDPGGNLVGLQAIDPSGGKLYLPGGRKGYFSIGKPGPVILIAEGFATGASLHETTGYPVAIAFDAGNLPPTAQALRAKLPGAKLILCADNDQFTGGNPGITKATEGAQVVGGFLAVPQFKDLTDKPTDFNDLVRLEGAEAVRQAVEAAAATGAPPPLASPQAQPARPSGKPAAPFVELIRGDSITPEAVSWLWNGYLVGGKLNILAGAPGTGKTTLALAAAATITNGGRWPDRTPAPHGDVLIWSGEDGVRDVLMRIKTGTTYRATWTNGGLPSLANSHRTPIAPSWPSCGHEQSNWLSTNRSASVRTANRGPISTRPPWRPTPLHKPMTRASERSKARVRAPSSRAPQVRPALLGKT